MDVMLSNWKSAGLSNMTVETGYEHNIALDSQVLQLSRTIFIVLHLSTLYTVHVS